MRVTGQCHCGQLAYEAEVDPATAAICHCTDCQVLSGSPYRVVTPTKQLKITKGQPKIYIKTTADSGRPRAQAFCADCGTPIFASAPDPGPDGVYMLRTGAIKERAQLQPRKAIWCDSAIPWAEDIGEVPKNAKQ